jgi:Asp-tRNA(Asn)/Glu-tRNA(Gln) amidotransferase A subunit family amidase
MRARIALQLADVWTRRANAFSHIFAHETLAAADGADEVDDGPLAGVPVAIKDLFDVQGHPTTGCCAAIPAEPAERDAILVQRLRAAGAVVIGKTNMHELAAGVTNLESACGPTRNPLDLSRMTGGSSGGSAAAVATGAVPLSLVSDTGGSARIPAAFCGVWGLKGTHGRLPLNGMMALAPEMDCAGLIGHSLEALEAGWGALGAPIDAASRPERIGVLRGGRWERCHGEIREVVHGAVRHLTNNGTEVRDVDGSELDDVHHVWNRIAWPAFAERYADLVDEAALGTSTAAVLRWGLDHRHERARALDRAERVRAWFADVFAEVDLLLTVTTPFVAPMLGATGIDLGDGTKMDAHRGGPAWFTTAANVAGVPALSVPFGRSDDGLPIGLQLIAAPDREAALLAGGALLVPGGAERPPLPEA